MRLPKINHFPQQVL